MNAGWTCLIEPFVSAVDVSSIKEHESFMRELSYFTFYYFITQIFIDKFVILLWFHIICGWTVPPLSYVEALIPSTLNTVWLYLEIELLKE